DSLACRSGPVHVKFRMSQINEPQPMQGESRSGESLISDDSSLLLSVMHGLGAVQIETPQGDSVHTSVRRSACGLRSCWLANALSEDSDLTPAHASGKPLSNLSGCRTEPALVFR